MNSTSSAVLSGRSRIINATYSFTSLGIEGSWQRFASGPSNVAITGRVYHTLRDFEAGERPLRWFVFDNGERDRLAVREGIPLGYYTAVGSLLQTVNPYISQLQHAFDTTSEDRSASIELKNPPAGNDEIAAIVNISSIRHVNPRTVRIFGGSSTDTQPVSILSSQYEPLAYPLLFPHGTPGWSDGVYMDNDSGSTKFSQIEWYKARLCSEERFNIFGRLTNEYLVDMYSRVEEERLSYIARGRSDHLLQAQLRAEARSEFDIDDELQAALASSLTLPASFVGSRAWASEQVSDALSLCREYGSPTLFVTITTNPKWPEIEARLRPGQSASDIPFIVARVFNSRLSEALRFIRKHFGKVVYEIRVIEWQKRGLPHAHIVFKIDPQPPFGAIESLVRATIPSETENSRLRAAVLRHNIHSQDHLTRTVSRCNKDGVCCFGFPHRIQDRSTIDAHGRISYKRLTEDDRWVVPYCPALTLLMDCHVHVDVCFTTNVFMYLYKYLFKGPDKTIFAITGPDSLEQRDEQPTNEIKDYIRGRYLSASEAAWRILGYNVTYKKPGVIAIQPHLPGRNVSQMTQINRPTSNASMILRYFARPFTAQFESLTILQYYKSYRTVKHTPGDRLLPNEWLEDLSRCQGFPQFKIKRRVGTSNISRLANVRPGAGELYYLRALLTRIPAYSFEQLRTVNGIVYPTFQEAATARGLFSDRSEAIQVLEEGKELGYSPALMRFLFVQVVANIACAPTELFNRYLEQLSGDFIDRFELDLTIERPSFSAIVTNQTLQALSKLLRPAGLSLDALGLPQPRLEYENSGEERTDLRTIEYYRTLVPSIESSLTPDQYSIYHSLEQSIRQYRDEVSQVTPLYFVDGKAGRGKTYVLSAIILKLRSLGFSILTVGTSALSATLYPEGRTAHSTFGVPVREGEAELRSTVNPNSAYARYLSTTDLIVWEELPMANKVVLECVDSLMRSICNKDEPFGGKAFIGVGDFRQVAPVLKGAGEIEVIDASVRSSLLWSPFTILRLTAPIRNASDPSFSTWVDQIGEGYDLRSQSFQSKPFDVEIHPSLIEPLYSIEQAADFLFPTELLNDHLTISSRSFLSPLNKYVDQFNSYILDKLPGESSKLNNILFIIRKL